VIHLTALPTDWMNIDKELARTQKKMTVARCKVQKAAATL
jgi:hypothetical protein